MAMVPGRGITPQVDVGAAPSARFEAPQFVNYDAQNTMQAGNNLSQLGGQIGQIAADMAERANAARIDDGANKMKDAMLDLRYNKDYGYANLKGEAALKRQNGAPSMSDEYTEKLKKVSDDIYNGLGNDVQKQAFKRYSDRMQTQFRGEAMQHEAQQNNVYMGSVAQATQETASREIALGWGDHNAIDGAAQRLRAGAYQEAQLTGKSPEWAEAKARDGLSKGHTLALTAAIERGDYSGASAYLDKYTGQMQADDILRARQFMHKRMIDNASTSAVDAVYSFAGKEFNSMSSQAVNVLWRSESNHQQFDKNGNVITSSKGAIGISQLMPSTAQEAAKLAGLDWKPELFNQKHTGDPVKDKEATDYNKALGTAYLNQQIKDFGKLDHAYAAYNAGPGAVRAAMKKAEKDGGTYLQYLPAETQNYVQKNMSAYGSGNGGVIFTQKNLDDKIVASLPEGYTSEMKKAALDKSNAIFEKIQKDPVLYALRDQSFGVNPLPSISSNIDGFSIGLSRRLVVMRRVSESFGSKMSILSESEASAFGSYVDSLLPQDKANVLRKISESAGPESMQIISAQLHDKNNQLAVAAMLSSHTTTKGNNAASLYLQGLDAIKQKRANINDEKETGVKATIYNAIDGVFTTPKGRDAAAEAAYGIYAKLKSDGIDDVEQAVDLATGGLMNFNGARIAKPYGWDDSRFRDELLGRVAKNVSTGGGEFIVGASKVKASDFSKMLSGARLKTFGQGSYLVMAGNDVVRTSTGAPYVLRMDK